MTERAEQCIETDAVTGEDRIRILRARCARVAALRRAKPTRRITVDGAATIIRLKKV